MEPSRKKVVSSEKVFLFEKMRIPFDSGDQYLSFGRFCFEIGHHFRSFLFPSSVTRLEVLAQFDHCSHFSVLIRSANGKCMGKDSFMKKKDADATRSVKSRLGLGTKSEEWIINYL